MQRVAEAKNWEVSSLLFALTLGVRAEDSKRKKNGKDNLSSRLFLFVGIAEAGHTPGHVTSYPRRDGTYVPDHHRSTPDGNPYNNWSYPGNTNPYTGKVAPGNPDTYLDRYQQRPNQPSGSDIWRRR
jgi:hypothetical protein